MKIKNFRKIRTGRKWIEAVNTQPEFGGLEVKVVEGFPFRNGGHPVPEDITQ